MEQRKYLNNLFEEDGNGGVRINELLNVEMKADENQRVFIFTNNEALSKGLRFNFVYTDNNEFSIIVDKIVMDLPIITVYRDEEVVDRISLEKYKYINLDVELSPEDSFVEFKCFCTNEEINQEQKKPIVDIITLYPQYFKDINDFLNQQIKAFNSILLKMYGEQIELVNLLDSITIVSNDEGDE